MNEHTPGPWEIVRSLTCGHLRAAHNYQTNPRDEFTDADITLIAAAPELLETLNDVSKWLDNLLIASGSVMLYSESRLQSKVRTAIAKAEGKQEVTSD